MLREEVLSADGKLAEEKMKGVSEEGVCLAMEINKISHMKTNLKEPLKPKRLSDKEMRELLLSLKKEAEKTPEEADSFSVEVICSSKDISQSK